MTKRTDLHRPSVINPADYDFVACDYWGSGMDAIYFGEERKIFRAHMERTGGKFAHVEHQNDVGGCDICGAFIAYVACFHHVPSNTYIVTGMDCAAKMDIGDPVVFRAFKTRVAAGLKAKKGKAKARAWVTENAPEALSILDSIKAAREAVDTRPLNEYGEPVGKSWYDLLTWGERKLDDLYGKLVQYGNFSEKQAEFFKSLPAQIAEDKVKQAAYEAKRAAEAANAKDIPKTDSRVTIEGEIISAKVQETDFGNFIKIVIKHADGWKVWGTLPNSLTGEGTYHDLVKTLPGKHISLDARIVISDSDSKFGFFKRPSKASMPA